MTKYLNCKKSAFFDSFAGQNRLVNKNGKLELKSAAEKAKEAERVERFKESLSDRYTDRFQEIDTKLFLMERRLGPEYQDALKNARSRLDAINNTAETQGHVNEVDNLNPKTVNDCLAKFNGIIELVRRVEYRIVKKKTDDVLKRLEQRRITWMSQLLADVKKHETSFLKMEATMNAVRRLSVRKQKEIDDIFFSAITSVNANFGSFVADLKTGKEDVVSIYLPVLESVEKSAESTEEGSLDTRAFNAVEEYKTEIRGIYITEVAQKSKQFEENLGKLAADAEKAIADKPSGFCKGFPHEAVAIVVLINKYFKDIEQFKGDVTHKPKAVYLAKFLDKYYALQKSVEAGKTIAKLMKMSSKERDKIIQSMSDRERDAVQERMHQTKEQQKGGLKAKKEFYDATLAVINKRRTDDERLDRWDEVKEAPASKARLVSRKGEVRYRVRELSYMHYGPKDKGMVGLRKALVRGGDEVKILSDKPMSVNGKIYIKIQRLDRKGNPGPSGWVLRGSLGKNPLPPPEKEKKGTSM